MQSSCRSLHAAFERPCADCSQPNGSLGACVVRHLKENDFNITLLTRNLEKTNSAFPGLKVVQVNYDSVDELTASIRNDAGKHDALIILINRDEAQSQIHLIDAAIASGISHIIPSAFGFTTTHPGMRESPVLEAKARMEDYLIQKAKEGRLTYTQIQNSAFFDWALDRGVYLNTKDLDAPTIVRPRRFHFPLSLALDDCCCLQHFTLHHGQAQETKTALANLIARKQQQLSSAVTLAKSETCTNYTPCSLGVRRW